MRTGRIERRVTLGVPLQFASLERPGELELTVTENVSSCGARVVARRPLRPEEEVLVTLRGASSPLQARVVYCRPLATGGFGVGLFFKEPPWSWKGRD